LDPRTLRFDILKSDIQFIACDRARRRRGFCLSSITRSSGFSAMPPLMVSPELEHGDIELAKASRVSNVFLHINDE